MEACEYGLIVKVAHYAFGDPECVNKSERLAPLVGDSCQGPLPEFEDGEMSERTEDGDPPPAARNHAVKPIIDDIAAASSLQFDDDYEDTKYNSKVTKMEKALLNSNFELSDWQEYAHSEGGLVKDKIRKYVWPVLGGVTKDEMVEAPQLDSLMDHPEYNQVKLDVDRSLKRFPPGIPYNKRVELQDQLTVLILRVIIKYPQLKYYQGYHDVAITLLLVCGEKASFPLLCRISHGETAPLAPFMQDTMEPTQHRLNYLHPLIRCKDSKLALFLKRSTVGTMFALPWYLTWFGHSLNRYSDVVRLYDYFLCAPPMFPIYVTAAIVLYRKSDVFELDCDLATLHCFLSQLPDDLPFEKILRDASDLYDLYPPDVLELKVVQMEKEDEILRKEEEERIKKRQIARRNNNRSFWAIKLQQLQQTINENALLQIVPRRYRALLATTTFFIGAYACYRFEISGFGYVR